MNIIKNKLNKSLLNIGNINRIFSENSPIRLIKRKNKPNNSFISFTIDTNLSIRKLNISASRLLESNRKNLINQSFLTYIPNHQKLFKEKIEKLLQCNLRQVCEISILQKDGTSRWVLFQCNIVEKNFISIEGIETTTLRQPQPHDYDIEKFRMINKLFHHADDAIAVLDDELNIKICNQLFTKLLFRMTSQEVSVDMNLDRALSEHTPLKAKIIKACYSALSGQKTSIVIENPNKDSDIYYCYEIRLHAQHKAYRQKNELIFRIKDTTDYKLQHKLQADITRTCKNSIISAMSSAIAHEINQPLTTIVTYSRSCLFLMNNKPDAKNLDEQFSLLLEKISSQAELAAEILLNMKKCIREENFYVERTDINQLIHDAISIFHYELLSSKLKITLNLEDNVPVILINRTHIIQVILNLARNSLEAFQNSNEEHLELTIETQKLDQYVHIKIKDNGPGVPKEYINKILCSYFTTKKQGHGIGLHICRTLIENHGGKLYFQNNEKQGASFTFTLPLMSSNEKN